MSTLDRSSLPTDSSIDWARFVELVESHQRFVLTTHVRPDCDAVGSTLAMADILETLGKQVTIAVGYQMPPNLNWLDSEGRFQQVGVHLDPAELDRADAILVLDTSAWAQLAHLETFLKKTTIPKIVVDHHAISDDIGAEYFKNDKAEATGTLVAEAADALGVDLTPKMATALFAAIATDTGWMRFPSVTSDTYRLVGRLVDAGASPPEIYRDLYEKETLPRLQLIGRVLARTETDLDGRLIYTWVRRADIEETGARPTDTEDIINDTLAVAGTEGAVILVEQINGTYKVSLRSRNKMNCAEVAALFGGGGHKAAAGAMLDGPLETARERLLDAVRDAMR